MRVLASVKGAGGVRAIVEHLGLPRASAHFVMVMLRPEGLARFFPATGADVGDSVVDLGACLGDGLARRLSDSLYSAWETPRRTLRVELAASKAGVSTRQLERWFQVHLGHSHRSLLGLERLHASLPAAQTGRGMRSTASTTRPTRFAPGSTAWA